MLLIIMVYRARVKDEERTTFVMIEIKFAMIVCLLILLHEEE